MDRNPEIKRTFENGVHDAFDIFADSNGKLTEHGAASLLRYLDKSPPASILDREAREKAGIDRTSTKGVIEFPDFLTMLLESIQATDWEQSAPDAFQKLDQRQDNQVTARDLKKAMADIFRTKINTKTAENMIQEADVDAKGYVNWDDFQRVLYAIELQTQKEIELQSTGVAPRSPGQTARRGTLKLPSYLVDARQQREEAQASESRLARCCKFSSLREQFFEARRRPHSTPKPGLEPAVSNHHWRLIHIFTRSGLLGRVQGQGEFWHGLEAVQQDSDLEQDETPECRDTWVHSSPLATFPRF